MEYIVIAIGAYLLGSIPSGLIIGKRFYHTDLREHGSKNIGATNAYRTLGIKPALFIFVADALKGAFSVLLGSYVGGTEVAMIVAGLIAIAGHNWSIFLKFKGGRGVATGLGVLAVLAPLVTVTVFLVWCIIVYFTRYVSLASVIAAMLVPVFMRVYGGSLDLIFFSVIAAFFVIIRHKANLQRLLQGTESKISAPKKKENSSL